MTKLKCLVNGCQEKVNGAWIDVFINRSHFGRCPFCDNHFNIIMPYAKKKEAEEVARAKKEENKTIFWAFVPLSVINEAFARANGFAGGIDQVDREVKQ